MNQSLIQTDVNVRIGNDVLLRVFLTAVLIFIAQQFIKRNL